MNLEKLMSKRDEIKQMIREALKKELIKNAKQQRITEAAKDFYDSVQLVKELKRSGSSKLPKAMSLAKIAQERLHESIEDDVAAVISIVEPSDEGMVVDNSPVYDSLLSAIASAKKLYMNINIDTEVNDWVIQQVIDAERSLRAACEYFNQQEAHTAAVEDREATVDYIGDGEYEDGGVMEEGKRPVGEDIRPLLRKNLNEAGMMIRGAAAASAAMYVASKGRSTGGVQKAIDASIEDSKAFYARLDKDAFESTYTKDMLKKAGYDVSDSKIKVTANTGDKEKTSSFLRPFNQFFGTEITDWFQAIKGSGNNSLISIGPGGFSGVSIFVVDKNGDKFRAAKKFKTGDAGEAQALEYLKSDEFKELIQYKDSGSDSNIF